MKTTLVVGPNFAASKHGDPLPFDPDDVQAAILTVEWDVGVGDMRVSDVKLVEREKVAT